MLPALKLITQVSLWEQSVLFIYSFLKFVSDLDLEEPWTQVVVISLRSCM